MRDGIVAAAVAIVVVARNPTRIWDLEGIYSGRAGRLHRPKGRRRAWIGLVKKLRGS